MAICMFCQWFMAIHMILTSCFKYWTEDTVYQLKLKVKISRNISCIWWQGRDDSARCLPEQGLSVDFIQRKTNLKTNKVLVKPSFNKSE